jgi:hypothetical protein
MPNPFGEADAAAQAASELLFGEEFEVLPRLPGGDYSGHQADSRRPAQRVAGILSAASKTKPLSGSVLGHDPSGPARLAGEPTTLWLSAEAISQLGYAIRQGDAVRCVERQDNPVYTVARAFSSGMGDVTLELAGESQT